MVRFALPVRAALTRGGRARRGAHTAPGNLACACALLLSLSVAAAEPAPAAKPAESPPGTAKPAESPPAVAPPASAADAAVAAAPSVSSRVDAQAEFRRLLDAKDYQAAIEQGRRIVELVRQDATATSEDLQIALLNLGAVQALADDSVGATETYQQVIRMIEGEGHLTTSRMSRAVAGVANAYYEAKRYDLAADAYDRALQLNRRNEGLFNEEQLPLLDRRADSLTSLGRYEEALQALAYGMRVAERRYGAEDQRTIDRLEQLGRWYTRVGAYEASRQALRNAVRLVEKRSGPNAIELVGPLLAIGESYREQLLDPEAMRESAEDDRNSVFHDSNASTGMPSRTPGLLAAEGERALERAVEIVDQQPQPSPVQVVDVRTQLGDWYQTRLQHDRALPQYQLAWAAAGQTPPLNGKSLREMLFDQPILLHYTPATDWKRYARRPADEVVARTVEIDLTVSAQGRVTGRKLVSNEGDAHMAEKALEAADTARYRPRFVDGKPVETPDVRLTQTYYEPIEKPKSPDDTATPAPSTKP